jgi:8-oxo-dGTP pyrophosphatase MutT (NUDIX family)
MASPPLLLPPSLRRQLPRALHQARQPVGTGLLRLHLGPWAVGWVHPLRLDLLRACWPALRQDGAELHWDAADQDMPTRSATIAAVAQRLRECGAITGWRDECYDAEAPVPEPCAQRGQVLFQLERAAFRFFGLMSRAVHVNGFAPGGRLLCGRRALSKATDPGRLDNLAAGGLSAGEGLLACARRECAEEAGVPESLSQGLQPRGALRSTRLEAQGLHDEVLHVYALRLPGGFVPRNADGEVSEFLSLDLESLAQRLAAGEFSIDAAAVCAWGLQHEQALADLAA